jgi:hypothetical protein
VLVIALMAVSTQQVGSMSSNIVEVISNEWWTIRAKATKLSLNKFHPDSIKQSTASKPICIPLPRSFERPHGSFTPTLVLPSINESEYRYGAIIINHLNPNYHCEIYESSNISFGLIELFPRMCLHYQNGLTIWIKISDNALDIRNYDIV